MESLKLRLLLKKRKLLRAKRNVALWMMLSDGGIKSVPRKKRESYVRPLNWSRVEDGEFHRLIRQMREIDPERFFKYFRMFPEDYDNLLKKVQHKLVYFPTHKFPIGASERLAVTLRVLATGDSVATVAASYRLGHSTVNKIVRTTVVAIYDALHNEVLKDPSKNPEIWQKTADDFQHYWNFPNCVGAIDGKHVMVQAPANQGSQFYNYKSRHSVVLMAVVNARYQFLAVDVGGYGRQSDAGTFAAWSLCKKLNRGTLGIPNPKELETDGDLMPHVFVADEAFPLTINIMIPYGGKDRSKEQTIADYRLSRARRVVENAFGILASRWQIMKRAMYYQPKVVDDIIKACVVLHNYLCARREHKYKPATLTDREREDGQVIDGDWRQEVSGIFMPMDQEMARPNAEAKRVRDNFRRYFNSKDGAVPWQDSYVSKLH